MGDKRTFIAAIVAAFASVVAALIALIGTAYPLVKKDYQWEIIQLGDCADIWEDYKVSDGQMGENPLPDRCDAKYRNKIAVCWDGKVLRNGDSNGKIADAINKKQMR